MTCAALALVNSSPCSALSPTAELAPNWREIAARDLKAAHDILRDNSPALYVKRNSSWFRHWLEAGYQLERRRLPVVADERGYFFLLKHYLNGFRDGHIGFSGTASLPAPITRSWPGFTTRWDGDHFVVLRAADNAHPDALPHAGATLLGCDGRSAERLAHERLDLYEADLAHADGRVAAASRLLWDRGNPFIGPNPRHCTFREAGRSRVYRLKYAPLAAQAVTNISITAAQTARPKFGIEAWGTRGWWIGIPSFGVDQDWDPFFTALQQKLDLVRSGNILIIDVRGNSGGASRFVTRLAETLWGEDFYLAHATGPGPITYRVSALNRRQYDADLASARAENRPDPFVESVVEGFDRAAANHRPLFTLDSTSSTFPKRRSGASPSNPVKARIVLLVDQACISTCLDFVDRFLAMPNVTLAGTETNADTIFTDVVVADLPSGMGRISYGHVAFQNRRRGSNVSYLPNPRLTYRGDLADDLAWRTWLAGRADTGALRGAASAWTTRSHPSRL